MAKLLKVKYTYDGKYEHGVFEMEETAKLYRGKTKAGYSFQLRKAEVGIDYVHGGNVIYVVLADGDNLEAVLRMAVDKIHGRLVSDAEKRCRTADENRAKVHNAHHEFNRGERHEQTDYYS